MTWIQDFYTRLAEAVADGGTAARGRVEAEARSADDVEITFPTYAALATWGNDGLQLIVKIAIDGHTVKSKSAALTLFSMLAHSGQFSVDFPFLGNPDFIAFLNDKIDAAAIQPAARHAIRLLIMSLPTEDLLIPLSNSFMHLQFGLNELAPELVAAISTKWLRFGPPVLETYEKMLVEKAEDEPAFQSFFCEYPQLLDPMATQVWSQPDFHGALEADFVIRRADDSYLVVEIECPAKLLLTRNGQLSRDAGHAEKQALDYEGFLSERLAEARTHFPNYRRAECLAVVGLDSALTPTQRQNLDRANERRQNMKIVGFDWLLERARTIVRNMSDREIEIVRRHRVI